jgi:hypothetical protein
MVEVHAVLGRLAGGKLKPDKAFKISYAQPIACIPERRTALPVRTCHSSITPR